MDCFYISANWWWYNCTRNVLSHWPGRAAAERGQVFLLLLDLQHQHQARILIFQVVEQEGHEVVDDIGLVALSACVHVNGYTGVFQCNPLRVGKEKDYRAFFNHTCIYGFNYVIHNPHCPSCRSGPSTISYKKTTTKNKYLKTNCFRLLFVDDMTADIFTWWWVSEALAECSEPDAGGCPIMIWVWSWRQISQRWTMLYCECQPVITWKENVDTAQNTHLKSGKMSEYFHFYLHVISTSDVEEVFHFLIQGTSFEKTHI